jgi:putative ATP-dependent endonuclease of the OLD family
MRPLFWIAVRRKCTLERGDRRNLYRLMPRIQSASELKDAGDAGQEKRTDAVSVPIAAGSSTLDDMAQPPVAGIRVVEVRVRNFRSLRAVDVPLDRVTLLVGKNNTGKTSFLDALFLAIGAGPRSFSEDDIHLATGEGGVPRDRRVTVDILVRPTDTQGNIADKFPAGPWLNLWGEGVAQDDMDHDLVAIRAQGRWDAAKGEYDVTRSFLRDWPMPLNDAHLLSAKVILRAVSNAQLEPLALYLLDAKRDIVADLRNRASFWSKLVSDPGLSAEAVKTIEATLSSVNAQIVSGSEVLTHLQTHLSALPETSGAADNLTIAPVSRHLRDLTKGMDVLLAEKDTATFPLARQGMGTRSVATLLTFRAYADWKQRHAKGAAVHPLLAIEEPETHLHPHAQRALFKQLASLPGQCIISTHSPYICGQASVLQFRVFRRDTGVTDVRSLTPGTLDADDLRKLHRQVINTRGDVLFATAVILVSGETEEQALPAFADAYWSRTCHELGINVIGVGGDGAYLPFLRLAECFGIPWYIFSDGEPKAIADVNAALTALGQPLVGANQRITAITVNRDFEAYMVDECEQVLVDMVIKMKATNEKHRQALAKEWADKSDQRGDLIDELRAAKTRYGRPIADAITAQADTTKRVPELIKTLFTTIARDLKIT